MSRLKRFLDLNQMATDAVKAFLGERVRRAKKDQRYAALFVVELFLALFLVGAIYIYLDPTVNLVPFPFNYLAFVVLFAAAMWIYRYTKGFRKMRL